MAKKILLLWSPLADYSLACLRELAKKPDLELSIVYHPSETDSPYESLDASFFRNAIAYRPGTEQEVKSFCEKLQPDIIFMASWNYPLYMKISRASRARGTYVVSVFDRQWLGTPKQWLGVFTSPVYLKPCIDNFFVAGDRQAAFAHKLGYGNPYQGYYSANTPRFAPIVAKSKLNHNFIFVGRLVPEKGVECLLAAYARYRASVPNPWNLLLCGKGELEPRCHNLPGVQVLGFTQPDELPARLASASCLILPSLFEPWGLVVHEAVTIGLAVIVSHHVGAATYFVRDGQNGYIINPDEQSLLRAMRLVSEAADDRLAAMHQTSRDLAQLWTVYKWADYVYENIILNGISSTCPDA
jgi:glycosyltransferase involved in cell wall biosynthesis